MLKCFGMICIIFGSATVGFCLSANVKKQNIQLHHLQTALCRMKSEILCRLTPLPEVFEILSEQDDGAVGRFFEKSANILQNQKNKDVAAALEEALKKTSALSIDAQTKRILLGLAVSLGSFDAEGQARAIELAEIGLRDKIADLAHESSARCRSYRTIGVCAGMALAVILV